MTLVQLQHFVALARAGSFVKASALVHVTQPALSRSIAGLEDELGQRLFDRLGRRIELTPFGHDTLPARTAGQLTPASCATAGASWPAVRAGASGWA